MVALLGRHKTGPSYLFEKIIYYFCQTEQLIKPKIPSPNLLLGTRSQNPALPPCLTALHLRQNRPTP